MPQSLPPLKIIRHRGQTMLIHWPTDAGYERWELDQLTAEDLDDIRLDASMGADRDDLAILFGVCRGTIDRVLAAPVERGDPILEKRGLFMHFGKRKKIKTNGGTGG